MGDYWSCLRGFSIVKLNLISSLLSSGCFGVYGVGRDEESRKSLSKKSILHVPKDLLHEDLVYNRMEILYRKILPRRCQQASRKPVLPCPDVCTVLGNKSCMCVSREFPTFFSSIAEVFSFSVM